MGHGLEHKRLRQGREQVPRQLRSGSITGIWSGTLTVTRAGTRTGTRTGMRAETRTWRVVGYSN